MINDNHLHTATFLLWSKSEFNILLAKYHVINTEHGSSFQDNSQLTETAAEIWKVIDSKLKNEMQELSLLEHKSQSVETLTKQNADIIEDMRRIPSGSFYACFYEKNKDSQLQYNIDMKLGIYEFTRNIERYPFEPFFHWMRGQCYIKVNQLQLASKDLDTAHSLDRNNEIFVYYLGVIADKLEQTAYALKNYKKGFKMLHHKFTKMFIHSLQTKVYKIFYSHCRVQQNNEGENNLIIDKSNWNIFTKELLNVFDNNQDVIQVFIHNTDRTIFDIKRLHDIFANKLLNNISFYRFFTIRLNEWQEYVKYIDYDKCKQYEKLNSFLLNCFRDNGAWNISDVLNGALLHVDDKLKWSKHQLTDSKVKLLMEYLPPFYRKVWQKHYVPNAVSENRLWQHEVKITVDEIIMKIQSNIFEFNDVLESSFVHTNIYIDNKEKQQHIDYDEKGEEKDPLLKWIEESKKQNSPFLLQNVIDANYRMMIKMNHWIDRFRIKKDQASKQRSDQDDEDIDEDSFPFFHRFGVENEIFDRNLIIIDDDINIHFEFILSIIKHVNHLSASYAPFQLDVWKIPKKTLYVKDEYHIKDKETGEIVDVKIETQDITTQLNVEETLKKFKLTYLKVKIDQQSFCSVFITTFRKMIYKLQQMDSNACTNVRICCVIDRRHGMLYIYSRPKENIIFQTKYPSLLYFERSSKSIFPVLHQHPLFGIFTSFHVHSPQTIKAYQYWNRDKDKRIGGRFFIEDVKQVWPEWFIRTRNNEEYLLHGDSDAVIKIPDNKFLNWYNDNVSCLKENTTIESKYGHVRDDKVFSQFLHTRKKYQNVSFNLSFK
eukprot:2812_1